MRFKKISLFIVLILLLIQIPFFNKVEAYSGGLLEGKQMATSIKGTNIDWTKTVSEATDGDPNTYVDLKYDGTRQAYLHYHFDKPTDIGAYQILLADVTKHVRLRLFDEKQNVLFDITTGNIVKDGTKIEINVPNVYEVWVSTTATGARIMEFDLFEGVPQQPSLENPQNLTVAGQSSTSVDLTWDAVNSPDVKGYYVYVDGVQHPGIVNNNFITLSGLTHGQTYSMYVKAVYANNVESGPSNIVTTTLEVPIVGNAILKIYLNSGIEREYDLSMTKINEFINWYDSRANGVGKNMFPFEKFVNIGSYQKITQYLAYDKIVTFDVNEY